MEYPSYNRSRKHSESFEKLHQKAIERNFNGSYVVEAGEAQGVTTYLEGWPIYARYEGVNDFYGMDAIQELSVLNKTVTEYVSSNDLVKMFRTYMKYIGKDEGFMDIIEKPEVELPTRKTLNSEEEIELPAGVRLGYSPNKECMLEFCKNSLLTGYALSNRKIWYSDKGIVRDKKNLQENDLPLLLRMNSDRDLGSLDTEFAEVYLQTSKKGEIEMEYDISQWEIVDTTRKPQQGLLDKILEAI